MAVPLARQDLVLSRVDDETLVLDPRTDTAHLMSTAHADVLAACDGHRSSSELARLLGRRVEDVDAVLASLAQLDLLVGGTDRRTVLRSGALLAGATVAAATGIVTIALPAASAAASTVGAGTGSGGDPGPALTPPEAHGIGGVYVWTLPAGKTATFSATSSAGDPLIVGYQFLGGPEVTIDDNGAQGGFSGGNFSGAPVTVPATGADRPFRLFLRDNAGNTPYSPGSQYNYLFYSDNTHHAQSDPPGGVGSFTVGFRDGGVGSDPPESDGYPYFQNAILQISIG